MSRFHAWACYLIGTSALIVVAQVQMFMPTLLQRGLMIVAYMLPHAILLPILRRAISPKKMEEVVAETLAVEERLKYLNRLHRHISELNQMLDREARALAARKDVPRA